MLEIQRKAQEEAAQASQMTAGWQQIAADTGRMVWVELAKQYHADLVEQLRAAGEALAGAEADLQDIQHRARQHSATPPQDRDAVQVWAERRARLIAEGEAYTYLAEQAKTIRDRAQAALDEAVAQTRDRLMVQRMQQWNERTREIQAESAAEIKRLQEKQAAWTAELNTMRDELLTPLVAAGAAPPSQVLATGLLVI